MDDVYITICGRWHFQKRKGRPSDTITIRFTTEGVQSGQSTKEAKNFLECRATKILEDPLRKYLKDQTQVPYFYEYFLVFRYRLPSVPAIEYDKMSIATCSANMLTTGPKTVIDMWFSDKMTDPEQMAWEHINYHVRSLRARYQFLLDNLGGPVGGCLDMLRLHRFKTMGFWPVDYFARHERIAGRDNGGLAGASSKINRRLRTLFDPYTSEDVLRLRQTCLHLRAVPWATASSQTSPESRSPSLWLDHYPNGIRY
ncbi:hypothetical protein FBEOM_3104 [Fusarium beomiforme]|uniref:Uncharacterized protein n=1 Tax=Fusarium beomiforme TaxID=44412 RepID=A0A9P5AS89_9HYPO|nr:hypothetical protein FBEOM_3104 [Fusarium beomiforme]